MKLQLHLKALCHVTSELITVCMFNFPKNLCKNNISLLEFVLLLGCSLYWSFVTLIFITNRKKAKLENTNISRYIYIYIF